jgi:hypothetical protein
MTTAQEPAGDYGYDLVHEEVRARRATPPDTHAGHGPYAERRPDHRGGVVSGDYSYDEAHGS